MTPPTASSCWKVGLDLEKEILFESMLRLAKKFRTHCVHAMHVFFCNCVVCLLNGLDYLCHHQFTFKNNFNIRKVFVLYI